MSLNEGEAGCRELKISVRKAEEPSLEPIRGFLKASDEIEFEAANRDEMHLWVTQTWVRRSTRGKGAS